MEEDYEEIGDQSPKRYVNSTRSNAAMGTTPFGSPSTHAGNIHDEVDLPPPPPIEMMERSEYISPVAKAFHGVEEPTVLNGKIPDTNNDDDDDDDDDDMTDIRVRHVETSNKPRRV